MSLSVRHPTIIFTVRAAPLLIVALASCRTVALRGPSCAPVASPDAAPVAKARIGELAGDWQLTVVDTSGSSGTSWGTITVHLAVPDSATVAQRRRQVVGSFRRSDLQLVGYIPAVGDRMQEPAEVDNGFLYVGCRDCFDGSPTIYRLLEISRNRFRGSWRNNMTGIAVLVDDKGRRQPDPEGYFCAERR